MPEGGPKCRGGYHWEVGKGCVANPDHSLPGEPFLPYPPPFVVRPPRARPPRPPPPERGHRTEVDEGFVAPVRPPDLRVPRPPKPPGTPTTPTQPSGPSPADQVGRPVGGQQRLPLPRGAPVAATVLRAVRDLSVAGVLSWVWALAFGPSLGTLAIPQTRPEGRGPPRRTRNPRTATPSDPDWWTRYIPDAPGRIGAPQLPIPVADPTLTPQPTTRRTPRVSIPRRTMPQRPRTLPRGGSTVSPVLAPAGWTLGDPVAGPTYDPYTYTPAPAPAPRAPARPFPRPTDVDFPWPAGYPVAPRSVPRGVPRVAPRPLTPQQPRPSSPPRTRVPRPVKLPSSPTLTPLQDPVPRSLPQFQPRPTEANPCTAQRTERRRRQRECKKFTTKTIRVCADK